MPLSVKDINDIKSKIEQDKRKQERASILMEEAKNSLKTEFKCNSVKEAKEKMLSFSSKASKCEEEIESLLLKLEELDQEEL